MRITNPSCLVLHATPHMGSCLRAGRVGPKVPTLCQAGGLQRNCQLAAAALLSSAALQYTVPLGPAVCASTTAVRSPPVGHTLAVKRALLEDLLMQEVGSRLKSMSDDDLVSVLEQVHQGRFQLPAAPLSLTTPQPSSDTRPGAVAPSTSGSMSSTSDSSIASSLADRQNATGSNSTVQGEQQSDKQAQPAATSPSGNQGADQQDTAAAKLLPDARQQQTFSLQAFTKPLMQRLQGSASTQASPSGADSGLVAGQGGDNHLQSNADQQSRQSSQPRSSQPQSSQPQSSRPQASQPESSQPASAQQRGGDKEQRGASLAADPALTDQGSAQEKLAQSRAPPGQAVSSEELTSSEKGLLQGGLLQSVEGGKGHDQAAEADMANCSKAMSALNEQDAGSNEEVSGASGRGQNVDEAEDTTTRMLESAGVPLPTSALNKPTASGAEKQPDRPSSVREYLGFVWHRTEPQLVLLVIASIISTLAGTLAQLAAARSHQHAAALLPSQHQHQSSLQPPGDNAQQVNVSQQRFASLRQAMWQGLLARAGRNKAPESARQAEPGQADAAVGSSQVQATTVPQISGGRLDNGNGLPSPVESVSNGQNHARQEDEWGRPIVQIPMSSGDIVYHHQASDAGQLADKLPSKVLWVRKDPEDHESSNSTELSTGQTYPRTVLWQRDQAHYHAAQQADGMPRRFRRSRLGKHAVSIESLLDNVE